MKVGTIINVIVGLIVIALLIIVGYRLVDFFVDFVSESTEDPPADGGYAVETEEPPVTMPPYMAEDSFYDDAENEDIHEQGID